jgi:uncharacterized protein YbjT (DUF2867 family)
MKIRAIVTGASGMVGEGVLWECLQDSDVEQVLVVGRKPCGHTHPKLKEVLHADFFNIEPIREELKGYNACFFCLGVSSVGMKEAEFARLTHTLTLHFACVLVQQSPDLTFCYVSGAGTDSTEKGNTMWARVKGKTENDLMKLPFRQVFAFRPGAMKPTPGLKNTLKAYSYFGWLFPILRAFFPNSVSTLAQVGQAMLHVAKSGYGHQVIEVRDVHMLTK